VKGKGYEPAENYPDDYHSFGSPSAKDSFHAAFSDELVSLAKANKKIVGITAAMGIGTGLDLFGESYPDRYFDVGIAEPHALTFAAGLAAGGHIPFVAIYSTFLQRGYDNLLHDIALQNLPVKIMIDRAGLACSDGATHHGIFDVSFISHIPNMTLLAPAGLKSLREMTAFALNHNGAVAIRYPNSREPDALNRFSPLCNDNLSKISVDFEINNPPEYLFITYGALVDRVEDGADILRMEGMNVGGILLETIKPYGLIADKLIPIISSAQRVVYAEEGIKNGGAGEILREELIKLGISKETDYRIAAIDDNFASPTSQCDLYSYVGLSSDKLVLKMKEE
jgi:1-deoxy-D-xylulose-5-phosphate synthase